MYDNPGVIIVMLVAIVPCLWWIYLGINGAEGCYCSSLL